MRSNGRRITNDIRFIRNRLFDTVYTLPKTRPFPRKIVARCRKNERDLISVVSREKNRGLIFPRLADLSRVSNFWNGNNGPEKCQLTVLRWPIFR